MAICKDPSLTYLNEQGYNVVRLPRAGIAPLDVLGRDGKSLERLGKLPQIWSSEIPPPEPGPPQPAAAISGQRTAELKLSIGLRFLASVLGAMGAEVPHLGFAYRKAKTIQFSLSGVEAVSVDPFVIGSYLSDGDLDATNPFVARYFDDDDAQSYVISEVLTSDSIDSVAKDSSGAEMQLDVPAIQEAVGVNVAVETSGSGETVLMYKGPRRLAFGFKAFGIAYVDGDWVVQGVKPSAGLTFAVRGTSPAEVRPVLFSDVGRVSLKDV